MNEYKTIFSKHGYSLFEPESLENAIIEAIEDNRSRYLYGIPIIIERSEIDFKHLLQLAKEKKLLKKLKKILSISAGIIQDRNKSKKMKELSKGTKEGNYNQYEFRKAYEDYQLTQGIQGFPPSLNYHLSFLFAKRQINILYKIKNRQRLTKTEREYFSRIIKKKLVAIVEAYPLAKEVLT